MIYYDRETEILTMDLPDLEHCGFDHDRLDGQLFLDGINDPGARWPARLVVLFGEGAFDGPPSPIRGQLYEALDALYRYCNGDPEMAGMEGYAMNEAGRALVKARGEDGDA